MKPSILILARCYLPGYRGGGPIRTIANMVERMSEEFDFRIITMDRDLDDSHTYANVQVGAWQQVGRAQVYYADPTMLSLRGIARLLRDTPHDLLYLNSFFSPDFTIRPLLASHFGLAPRKPVVIAPRGEFSEGALSIKRWKKAPYTRIATLFGLFNGVTWHASTGLEVSDIQRALSVERSSIHVARNVVVIADYNQHNDSVIPNVMWEFSDSSLALRVCFLSRISPMKNLDYALKVLSRVSTPVQFDIYGPQESADYWAECEELISTLPSHVQVNYRGSVEHSHVSGVISGYDLLFVPSRGENFGHIFLEAWSAGVPVLISDQTPWRALASRKVGWDLPLANPELFVQALEEMAAWDSAQRASARDRCLFFAREHAEDPETLIANRNLFITALSTASSI